MSSLTPFFGAALIALGIGSARAHDLTGAPAAVPISGAAAPVYECVQQATAMVYDGTNMTLQGIAPSTVFFSDRPYRLSGQVPNETFVNLWNAPDGTFAGDPPNAAVTVLSETGVPPVIVELTSAKVDGASLQYGVKVISGELPGNASNVAVFIDHGSGFGGGGFHGGGGGMPGGGFHGGGGGMPGGGHFHGGGGGMPGGGHFHGGGGGMPGGGHFHGGGGGMPGGGHFHGGGLHGGGHVGGGHHGGGSHSHNHHHHSHTNDGTYCDHAPQDPQCHNLNPYPPSPPPSAYGPDYPYGPYGPYVPYDPAAAAATGAAAGAAAAGSDDRRTYKYPVPAGPIPKHCHININHTRMICTVPQN